MERAVFERMEAIDATHWWFGGRRAIALSATCFTPTSEMLAVRRTR